MIDRIHPGSDALSVRVMLNVTYQLNGEPSTEMVKRLQQMVQHAVGNGMLTGDTAAEVEGYEVNVPIEPDPLAEAEIAWFMQERIREDELSLDDIPARLARYRLMEPDAFISEMRERMEAASGD